MWILDRPVENQKQVEEIMLEYLAKHFSKYHFELGVPEHQTRLRRWVSPCYPNKELSPEFFYVQYKLGGFCRTFEHQPVMIIRRKNDNRWELYLGSLTHEDVVRDEYIQQSVGKKKEYQRRAEEFELSLVDIDIDKHRVDLKQLRKDIQIQRRTLEDLLIKQTGYNNYFLKHPKD